jgi:SAM-dependent methyltransferase
MPETSLTLSLELSPHLSARRTRERCPNARMVLSSPNGERDLGALRVDVEKPELDLDDGSVDAIDAQGVLANVIDEAAWLAEVARVLSPGGTLRFTVPAGGPLAWLDAQNIYRYVGDILGRGDNPDATLPTGWNRHYRERDIEALLVGAGFRDPVMTRAGVGLTELPQLAGLMVGNFLLGKRDAEMRLFPLRHAMVRMESRIPAPAIGTLLTISATRAIAEPDDPADDSAPENRPAPEIDSE